MLIIWGFIFYPLSKRSIDVTTAQSITATLRQRADCPLLVGVFVNETAAEILEVVHLDFAQLSGEEVPFIVDQRSPLYGRSYKALRPTSFEKAKLKLNGILHPKKQLHNPPC